VVFTFSLCPSFATASGIVTDFSCAPAVIHAPGPDKRLELIVEHPGGYLVLYGRGSKPKLRLTLTFFYCAALCFTADCPAEAQTPQSLALTHVTVVDVAEGRLLPDMAIVIRGDRIMSIERSSELIAPRNATLVNAQG
jgi:hypothetical protein